MKNMQISSRKCYDDKKTGGICYGHTKRDCRRDNAENAERN